MNETHQHAGPSPDAPQASALATGKVVLDHVMGAALEAGGVTVIAGVVGSGHLRVAAAFARAACAPAANYSLQASIARASTADRAAGRSYGNVLTIVPRNSMSRLERENLIAAMGAALPHWTIDTSSFERSQRLIGSRGWLFEPTGDGTWVEVRVEGSLVSNGLVEAVARIAVATGAAGLLALALPMDPAVLADLPDVVRRGRVVFVRACGERDIIELRLHDDGKESDRLYVQLFDDGSIALPF